MDLRTSKQNQYFVGMISKDHDIDIPPRQPATAAILTNITNAVGGQNNVPQSVKVAAAFADKFSVVHKYISSLLNIGDMNPRLTPLHLYTGKVREMDRIQSTLFLDPTVRLTRDWRKLGPKQGEKLTEFLDDL